MSRQLAERKIPIPINPRIQRIPKVLVPTLSPPASYMTLGQLVRSTHKNVVILLDDFGVHFPAL